MLVSQSVTQSVQQSLSFCFLMRSKQSLRPIVYFLFVLSMISRISLLGCIGISSSFFIKNMINYYQLDWLYNYEEYFNDSVNFKFTNNIKNITIMKNLILQEIKLLKKKNVRDEKVDLKDEVASEKNSVSAKSSKTQSTIIRSGFDLFKDMIFCFPIVNIELSPKRVQIITRSIIAEGGTVISFQGKVIPQPIDYLLICPTQQIELDLNKIGSKIQFKNILDFNFVLDSIREGVVLAIQKYSLYKDKNGEEKQQKTYSMPIIPSKLVKLNDEKYTYFRQKFNDKVQLNTDDDEDDINLDKKSQSQKQKAQQINLVQSCKRLLENKQQEKYTVNKDTFLCQKTITKESIEKFSMNKLICEELMKLQKIYESQKDIGRKIAYLKAVSVIKSLNFQIESEKDLQNVKGIGKKIIDKIKELMLTGKLTKLQRLQQCEKNKSETDFCKVWGIGPSKAQQLFKQGIKTIEELRQRTDLLNKNQRLGLKYFEDLQIKIKREKITKIFELIKISFSKIVDSIDNYNIEVCGSYRRGRQLCGDIDIIISRKDGFYEKKLLLDVILQLQNIGFLTDHLQFPSAAQSRSSLSYMGICKFQEEIHHRIDIKYYPIQEYAFALLYFTGSDMFNRSMRLYARKVGLQLSDHRAHPRRDERTGVIWENPVPFCETEKDIFDFMGLDYKTPRQRQV